MMSASISSSIQNPLSARSGSINRAAPADPSAQSSADKTAPQANASDTARTDGSRLDQSELKVLQSLKARDREVRAHEAAHQSVGGQYAGSASFTYQRGPDGAQYAIGGEVPITINAIKGDPAATIDKMRTVQSAALAPAQPSGQDRAVAAKAMQIMLQAQAELALQSGAARPDPGKSDDEQASATPRQARNAQSQYRTVSRLEAGGPTASGDAGPTGNFRAIA